MLLKVLAAASAATLLAGVAYAQPAPNASSTDNNLAAPQAPPPAPGGSGGVAAPSAAGVEAGGSVGASTSSGYNVNTGQTDAATGAQVVTNGPVPDTRQNRSLYGQPDSRAGRRTRPAGN